MKPRCVVAVSGLLVAVMVAACGGGSARLTEWQRVRSGALEVVVSPHDALRHGQDAFVIEFRSADGTLVDVGDVRAGANMSMAGTPMMGSVTVKRGDVPGRYAADSSLSMAGTWRLTVEWDGPAGKGAVTFSGSVQ